MLSLGSSLYRFFRDADRYLYPSARSTAKSDAAYPIAARSSPTTVFPATAAALSATIQFPSSTAGFASDTIVSSQRSIQCAVHVYHSANCKWSSRFTAMLSVRVDIHTSNEWICKFARNAVSEKNYGTYFIQLVTLLQDRNLTPANEARTTSPPGALLWQVTFDSNEIFCNLVELPHVMTLPTIPMISQTSNDMVMRKSVFSSHATGKLQNENIKALVHFNNKMYMR